MTMTELCAELRNWFDRGLPVWKGSFEISDGSLQMREDMSLLNGQYYRISDSVFNDGVHQYPDEQLSDESFSGTIRAMAVPPAVIALAADISAWETKYGDTVNSPYTNESFGGYSYTKASGGGSGDGVFTWRNVFSNRLNKWRKI